MKHALWSLVFTIVVVPAVFAGNAKPMRTAPAREYLVRLDDRLPVPVAALAEKLGRAHGVEITHVYSAVFNGFAFHGSDAAARAISRKRYVSRVETSPVLRLMYQTQSPIPSQGLDRIDERAGAFGPLDNAYTYNETGYGSVIYVLDTGVNPVSELAGRIIGSTSYVPSDPSTSDCASSGLGHGTSVATIAAGSTHGVAKQASIVNMKVVKCNENDAVYAADLIAALNGVAVSHSPSEHAVVNLSLAYFADDAPGYCRGQGCTYKSLIADAAYNLVTRGITVVTAVPQNAPNFSPCTSQPAGRGGQVSGMISVSEATIGDSLHFYNGNKYSGTGLCVDMFAPTPTLASMSAGPETSFGGSSAAVPLVAGVVALIQERQPSIATNPAAIEQQIIANSSQGVIAGLPAGTANRMLHSLPSVSLTMPSSLNSNQTFTASTPAVSGATYQWKVAGGTILSGQGTNTVTMQAGSCTQARTMAAVTVTTSTTKSSGLGIAQISKPNAYVYGDAWISAGQSTDVYAQLTGIGPWTVAWSDGSTQTVTSSPAVHTVSPTETTYYSVSWFTDAAGCYGTPSGYATINVE